ncbi:MAG: protein kinase, partial [Myxococcales bacterium]|nr:protein kinase [Myxococcales bacterium]
MQLEALLVGGAELRAAHQARHLVAHEVVDRVLARDHELDRDVALKLLRVSELGPGAGKRLVREAKVLARLDHPACVRVSDAGTFSGAPYLVMELLVGQTLDALLGTPWPAMRAIETTLTLLGGLAHAHEQGLVHRDLKPGNVMVVDGQIKIIDFGVVAVA